MNEEELSTEKVISRIHLEPQHRNVVRFVTPPTGEENITTYVAALVATHPKEIFQIMCINPETIIYVMLYLRAKKLENFILIEKIWKHEADPTVKVDLLPKGFVVTKL